MNALQRQNSRPRQTERQGHTNHQVIQRVKVRQNVSKRLKTRQMCVATQKTSLINCTGHPIMYRKPNRNNGLRS